MYPKNIYMLAWYAAFAYQWSFTSLEHPLYGQILHVIIQVIFALAIVMSLVLLVKIIELLLSNVSWKKKALTLVEIAPPFGLVTLAELLLPKGDHPFRVLILLVLFIGYFVMKHETKEENQST